jgi:hypothetical protein
MYTTKSLQRGFTEKSAPLNAAFILEEARRESWDENNLFIIVKLDAKSAFDVVVPYIKTCYESYITSELMIFIGQLSIACTQMLKPL